MQDVRVAGKEYMKKRREDDDPQVRRIEVMTRDLCVLRMIGEQYALRLDQLQHYLADYSPAPYKLKAPRRLSADTTRDWRARMRSLGVIEEAKVFHQQPLYLWLTSDGLKLTHLDFKPLKPASDSLDHCYWCTQVRRFLAERRPESIWKAERFLRQHAVRTQREQRGEGRASPSSEVPDAHVETDRGVIAIEVELSRKSPQRLVEILRERTHAYYTVWYFCSPDARRGVEQARAQLAESSQDKVKVYDLPE